MADSVDFAVSAGTTTAALGVAGATGGLSAGLSEHAPSSSRNNVLLPKPLGLKAEPHAFAILAHDIYCKGQASTVQSRCELVVR